MKKHLVLLVFVLTFSISQNISAQINTAAGGAAGVLPNSPTTNTNVGIGTNAPKSKLDVEGGVSIGTTYSGTTASPTNGAIIEGNVGIGTNAPANRLHITSATAGTSGLRFTNLISTTATTSGLLGKALSVNASGDVVLVPVANTDTSLFLANGALASARTVTMSGFGLTFNPSTANSQFFINGTNGNTGIGNIAPTTRLEVTSGTAGDSGVKLTNLLSTSTATTANGKALSVDTTGKVILVPVPASVSGIDANATLTAARTLTMSGFNYMFNPSTANSQFFINGTNGNTGIGNAAPTTRLEVTSGTAGDSGVKLTNLTSASTTTAANGKALSVDASGKVILVTASAGATTNIYNTDGALAGPRIVAMGGNNLSFNPSNNASFYINGTSGNVGIGIATPTEKLEVIGNVVAGGSASTSGVNGFSIRYDAINTINNWGSLYSSSASYMGFGVKAAVGSEGWVSSVPLVSAKSSMALDSNGAHFYVAPSAGVANGTAIAMNEIMNVNTNGNVGIGINTPNSKLTIAGNHVDTKLSLFSSGNGTDATKADLTLWASEPNLTYTGAGIGNNMTNAITGISRVNTARGGSYIRLLDNGMSFNTVSAAGTDKSAMSFAGDNVGFGTTTPAAKLHVSAPGSSTPFDSMIVDVTSFGTTSNSAASSYFKVRDIGAGNYVPFIIKGNGNVGIGAETPTEKLDVVGNIKATKAIFPGSELSNQTYTTYDNAIDSSIVFSAGKTNPLFPNRRLFDFYDMSMASPFAVNAVGLDISGRDGKKRLNFAAYQDAGTEFTLSDKLQSEFFKVKDYGDATGTGPYLQMGKINTKVIIGGYANDAIIGTHSFVVKGSSLIQGNILTDSNIGIGTSSFQDAADSKTYKLSVKGRIRAEEVKVYNTWADYVFNKEYNLRSLNDLEAYIKANGHLPNVPSAKEVTEKGLELGEMTRIQQEKIEELTLYLIQQNKEIQELKAQMKALMEKK